MVPDLCVIEDKIYDIRGVRVMLDFDLAEMYEIETRRLKEQVKRNFERFPPDFMFQLSKEEWKELVAKCDNFLPENIKYSPVPPLAFTQEGVAMLSGILRSPIAIQVNINIMRTFVRMREYLLTQPEQRHLIELRQQIKHLQEDVECLERDHEEYEKHFDDIYLALAQLAEKSKGSSRRQIGFIQKEN